MRDVLNGVLNSRVNSSGLFSSFDWFKQTQQEKDAGVTPTNYSYPPYDIRRYGAVGDSNGNTGNGTDNTAAIQAAVTAAMYAGGKVTAPAGTFRFTAPIVFTGTTNKIEFVGDSTLQTIFFADFTSVSPRAAFNLGNTSGTRAYVAFRNFLLKGVLDTNTDGIYCDWTSSLTEMENLYVYRFYNGITVANDFYTKLVNVQSNFNLNNGVQFGYEIDRVTIGRCFNIGTMSCDFSNNGASGFYALGAETIGFCETSSEANARAQYELNACEGVFFGGCYMECLPTGSPVAQLYLLNCNGVSVKGLTATAFRHDGSPIIYIETCIGVDIGAFMCRTSTGPFNAIGVKLKQSKGVSINNCSISDCATAIFMDATAPSELSINDTTLLNYTNSVVGGAVAHHVYWNQAVAADVALSSFNAANSVDIWYNDNTKNKVDTTKVFNASATFTNLATAGTKIVIPFALPSERWRIMDIIAYVSTSFNAGGDRTVQVLDATAAIVYTTITAVSLKLAPAVNRWGSAVVPFPVSADLTTPTGAGHNLVIKYAGGATDYTSGVIDITVTAMRTA